MEYIRVTKENLEEEHICCAISNNKDVQVSSKKAWLADRFDEGLVFLKNRYIHVDYDKTVQSATRTISKCNNCTLEELAIIRELQENPTITQKELALKIGKSERTSELLRLNASHLKSELPASTTTALATMLRNSMSYTMSTGV